MSMIDPGKLPRLAIIAGPTASGKSALALDWAAREAATIVNADASQVYRDLRILTARPSPLDEARAPHRLFGHRDGAVPCSAAAWAGEARDAVAVAWTQGRLPILVGGTGLYLRTLLDGIAPVPEIDATIRSTVRTLGASEAHAALLREDGGMARRLHPHDIARVHRALEVIRSTGRSLAEWRAIRIGGLRPEVELIGRIVRPPIAELYARCDSRVQTMLTDGAVAEVAALLARRLDPALPVMRAIGVAPIADLLRGEIDLATARSITQRHTRNYAKRQYTWFRHQSLLAMM